MRGRHAKRKGVPDEAGPSDKSEAPAEPRLDLPDAPTVHADVELEASDPQPADESPASAEAGIEMEDTSFLYGPGFMNESVDNTANEPDDRAMSDNTGPDDSIMHVDALFHDCIALLDALQVAGVDGVQANRYVASIVREKCPSVMEMYGGGSIINMANDERRDLNILGKSALDLRTRKPNEEPWGFSKSEYR